MRTRGGRVQMMEGVLVVPNTSLARLIRIEPLD